MYCSTAEDLDISSLVAHNLQLPKEMEIKAKFSSLILYNGGNGFTDFTHSLGSSFVEGKFGAAILQVPVEGGHKGGKGTSINYVTVFLIFFATPPSLRNKV